MVSKLLDQDIKLARESHQPGRRYNPLLAMIALGLAALPVLAPHVPSARKPSTV